MGSFAPYQLPTFKSRDRLLDRTARKSGFVGELAQSDRDRTPLRPDRSSIQEKEHEKGRGVLIVPHEIAHEDVDDVLVDRNARSKSWHTPGNDIGLVVSMLHPPAIPLNGQRFLAASPALPSTFRRRPTYVRPVMITHIKFVSIPVRDQKRALAFYTEKLGFTILTDQPFNEKQRWIELRIPRAETRIVLFTPEGHENRVGSFSGVSLTCDDIEQTYAELKSRGVTFEGPPQKQPWGTYAMFEDSEGNKFVLSGAK